MVEIYSLYNKNVLADSFTLTQGKPNSSTDSAVESHFFGIERSESRHPEIKKKKICK